MKNVRQKLRNIAAAAVIAGFIAGCGGSGKTASAPGGTTTPPPPITGIATPNSVSVVTATNVK